MRTSNPFAGGFLSALLLLAGLALIAQTVQWVTRQPQPEAFVELMNTPMFSPLDLITGTLLLLVLGVLITVPAWAPRP